MNNNAATAPALPGATSRENATLWTGPRLVLVVLVAMMVIALGILLGIFASWKNSGQIAPGMIVQGEPLGGLSKEEAEARLQKRFGRLFVTLETPERPYTLALHQLGGEVLVAQSAEAAYKYGRNGNLVSDAWKYWTSQKLEQRRALPIRWDKATLRKTMWTVATNYKRAPQDAKLEVNESGIQIVPEENGRAMNVGATCALLQKQYFAGKPAITAKTETLAPRLAAADLAGRDVLLGSYTTYFNAGIEGRTRNIYLAAAAVNGKVLMPGEKFSFNASTGERTPEKGYRIAHIFLRKPGAPKAEIVEGTGGGTCQVSSTLYNAVRKTNNRAGDKLDILERNHHSLPVTYVPTGLDATVAWPYKDFRFRNEFPHPVYIRTEIKGSHITIGIWGRVPENVGSVIVTSDKQASTPLTASDD
jgi:vancomycin resistance protein YoaR